jgi:hypothetical protein
MPKLFTRAPLNTLLCRCDDVLGSLGNTEFDRRLGFDLDWFSRLRVPAEARGTLGLDQLTENSPVFLVSWMAVAARRSKNAADCFVGISIFSATSRTNSAFVIFFVAAIFFAGAAVVFLAAGAAVVFAGAFFVAM